MITRKVSITNAVDEVTQWEIVASVSRIAEYDLEPLLKSMLNQFPFHIMGFHSDNGGEYVNRTIADLLNKLLICFTRSRPRRPDDNGLVESKNGSVIRKNLGYVHIPQGCASSTQCLSPGKLKPLHQFPPALFLPRRSN